MINKRLAKFLKSKGVLGSFLTNASNDEKKPIHKWRNLGIVSISSAFIWENTKEGQEFWEALNDEWRWGKRI